MTAVFPAGPPALLVLAALMAAVSAGAFADYELARDALERRSFRTGVAAMRDAAHAGDARAQNHLGTLYEDGEGVARDFDRAAFWYRKAAEQGHPSGQLNLGRMFRGGMGVRRDERRAAAWYRAAAWRGVPEAQFFLGLMHENGRGVEQDPAQAWVWFSLAADQGDEDAAFRRDRLAAKLGTRGLAGAQEALGRYRATQGVRGAGRGGVGSDADPERAAAVAERGDAPGESAKAAPPTPPPVRGDPLIFRIQAALLELGYTPGEHDGEAGSRTREAVRRFEAERRYRPRGRFDERLLDRLRKAIEDGKPAAPVIREIQSHLSRLGYPVGEIDGLPGPRTAAAVRTLQRDRGLAVDGRLSLGLLARLREEES